PTSGEILRASSTVCAWSRALSTTSWPCSSSRCATGASNGTWGEFARSIQTRTHVLLGSRSTPREQDARQSAEGGRRRPPDERHPARPEPPPLEPDVARRIEHALDQQASQPLRLLVVSNRQPGVDCGRVAVRIDREDAIG